MQASAPAHIAVPGIDCLPINTMKSERLGLIMVAASIAVVALIV